MARVVDSDECAVRGPRQVRGAGKRAGGEYVVDVADDRDTDSEARGGQRQRERLAPKGGVEGGASEECVGEVRRGVGGLTAAEPCTAQVGAAPARARQLRTAQA